MSRAVESLCRPNGTAEASRKTCQLRDRDSYGAREAIQSGRLRLCATYGGAFCRLGDAQRNCDGETLSRNLGQRRGPPRLNDIHNKKGSPMRCEPCSASVGGPFLGLPRSGVDSS